MKKICSLLLIFVISLPFFGLDNAISFGSGYAFRALKHKDLSDGSYNFGALTFELDYSGFFTDSVGLGLKGKLYMPMSGKAFKDKRAIALINVETKNDWSTGLLFAVGPVFRLPFSKEFELLSSINLSYEATWLRYITDYDYGGKHTYKETFFYQSYGAMMGFSGVYNFTSNAYVRGGFDASFGLLPLKQLFECITYDKDNKKVDFFSFQQTLERKDIKEFFSATFVPTIGIGFRF